MGAPAGATDGWKAGADKPDSAAEANDALIASTSAHPRKGSGGLRMEEEYQAGREEKLSPRRSTGAE